MPIILLHFGVNACLLGLISLAGLIAVAADPVNLPSVGWAATVCMGFVVVAYGIRQIAPALAEAGKTLGPTLIEIQKYREEFNKGSLSAKIEALTANGALQTKLIDDLTGQLDKASDVAASSLAEAREATVKLTEVVEAGNARTEDANKKLHALRNEQAVERNKAEEEREKAAAERVQLHEELNRVGEELVRTRAELAQANADRAELTNQLAALTEEVANLRAASASQAKHVVQAVRASGENVVQQITGSGESIPAPPMSLTPTRPPTKPEPKV